MVKELLHEYIKKLMAQRGYGENYDTQMRHMVMQSGEHRDYEAYNELYVLIEPIAGVNIKSDFGIFDLSFSKVDELLYVHEGFISIHNYSPAPAHVRFIQVIPILRNSSNGEK